MGNKGILLCLEPKFVKNTRAFFGAIYWIPKSIHVQPAMVQERKPLPPGRSHPACVAMPRGGCIRLPTAQPARVEEMCSNHENFEC